MAQPSNTITAEEYEELIGSRGPRRQQREGRFTTRVRRYAIRGGWLFYHTYRSQNSDPGFLDITCLRPPRLVVAELKVPPNNRLTDWQTLWSSGWQVLSSLAGPHLSIEVYTWTPDDWPEIERVLS